MTAGSGDSANTEAILRDAHQLLADQFSQLRESRDQRHLPVYALEHDLAPDSLAQVCEAVRSCVALGRAATVSRDSWLPFLVYSVEVAYDYDGREYWQGFGEKTPGWNQTTDRDLLADWFHRFHLEYAGAEPQGRWAAWFKKISWPITNAVLPVYLQRQLAQLLYEDRGMAGVIQEPAALGVRLGARANGYSTRFRQFCENTALLGTVGSSLLLDQDETSPYLTSPALNRLIQSVQSERQTRIWLDDTRAAKRVNTRGFALDGHLAGRDNAWITARAPSPELSLRRRDGLWEVCVMLPDLRSLAERLPELGEALESARARLYGRSRPLARGRLLDPDQVEALDEWPETNRPLIILDGCGDRINNTLGDFCLKTPGPWWVFREVGNGSAIEVRGKALRPGESYLLLTTSRSKPPLTWIEPIQIRTSGVTAFRAAVPTPHVTDVEEKALVDSGLSFLSSVIARPVGLVAALWDGQGGVEWIVGEPMMIGIHTDRTPTDLALAIDGRQCSVQWPSGQPELVVGLSDLAVGEHSLSVVLRAADGSSIAHGVLAITVRDIPVRPAGGAPGEGIRLRIDPARPTLDELWSRSMTLSVDGPAGADVQVEVDLRSEHGENLLKQPVTRNAVLPLTNDKWLTLAASIRKDLAVAYDDAESCVLTVSRAGLGFAQVIASRPFRPLWWRITKAHGNKPATARLVDQTDANRTQIRYYSPWSPLMPTPWSDEASVPPEGGLATGESGDIRTSILLPPEPNWLMGEAWKELRRRYVPPGAPKPTRLIELIDAYELWSSAELPGDLFAETIRDDVLSRIDNALCYLITDREWVDDEKDDLLGHWATLTVLLSTDQLFRDTAREIGGHLYEWTTRRALVEGFSTISAPLCERYAPGVHGLGPFLAYLADRPGMLSAHAHGSRYRDGAETRRLLAAVLAKPLLYKLARMAAIGARATNGTGDQA